MEKAFKAKIIDRDLIISSINENTSLAEMSPSETLLHIYGRTKSDIIKEKFRRVFRSIRLLHKMNPQKFDAKFTIEEPEKEPKEKEDNLLCQTSLELTKSEEKDIVDDKLYQPELNKVKDRNKIKDRNSQLNKQNVYISQSGDKLENDDLVHKRSPGHQNHVTIQRSEEKEVDPNKS